MRRTTRKIFLYLLRVFCGSFIYNKLTESAAPTLCSTLSGVACPLHTRRSSAALRCSGAVLFDWVIGSIPTAPTNHPFSQQQLSDLSRRQKAAIRASRVAPKARMSEFQRCCTKVGRWTAHQRIAHFQERCFGAVRATCTITLPRLSSNRQFQILVTVPLWGRFDFVFRRPTINAPITE